MIELIIKQSLQNKKNDNSFSFSKFNGQDPEIIETAEKLYSLLTKKTPSDTIEQDLIDFLQRYLQDKK